MLAGLEPELAEELASLLGWAGLSAVLVTDPDEAVQQVVEGAPRLVLIDVDRLGSEGRTLLKALRDIENTIPVMILGTGGALERTIALDEGADDYLVKPCDIRELVARVRAIIRRSAVRQGLPAVGRLICQDLMIDRLARRAWLGSEELTLTPKAFAVLEYLMINPGQLITRERLLNAVWGWDYPAGIRTVDTRIFELRQALHDKRSQPRFIETLAGQGYRWLGEVKVAT
ncbi:MAG: response regulator [Anaerolineae bacterium]